MLILGRLDQLEPELRALTGRASVLGRSFLKNLLGKLEERLGISSSEALDSELSGLTSQQVLGQEPGDRYFFEHVLTHEAAYGALLKSNRTIHNREANLVRFGAIWRIMGHFYLPYSLQKILNERHKQHRN